MKTQTEIEIKKIRKQLKVHTLTAEEKNALRDRLADLKTRLNEEKKLVENI